MRVFYTGDMANFPGWFRASADGINLRLVEEPGEFSEGRTFVIFATQLGNVYQGHCNPRFVTEAAFQAFRAARMGAR